MVQQVIVCHIRMCITRSSETKESMEGGRVCAHAGRESDISFLPNIITCPSVFCIIFSSEVEDVHAVAWIMSSQ